MNDYTKKIYNNILTRKIPSPAYPNSTYTRRKHLRYYINTINNMHTQSPYIDKMAHEYIKLR